MNLDLVKGGGGAGEGNKAVRGGAGEGNKAVIVGRKTVL